MWVIFSCLATFVPFVPWSTRAPSAIQSTLKPNRFAVAKSKFLGWCARGHDSWFSFARSFFENQIETAKCQNLGSVRSSYPWSGYLLMLFSCSLLPTSFSQCSPLFSWSLRLSKGKLLATCRPPRSWQISEKPMIDTEGYMGISVNGGYPKMGCSK